MSPERVEEKAPPGGVPPKGALPTGAARDLCPRAWELVAIALVAILLRGVVAELAVHHYGMTAAELSNLRDGDSYIRVGLAMTGDETGLKPFDRRVFPGYPALIALLSAVGLRADMAALVLNWLCTGLAAALSAVLFRDRRVGWAMAILTPSYLMYSTMAMSEATLLAFTTSGLVVAVRGRTLLGGVLLGYAILIRPVACFAVLGYIVYAVTDGKRTRAVVSGLAALAVVMFAAAGLYLWRGDALEGFRLYASDQRAYGGEPFTWPFESLIMTPLVVKTTVWKMLYIYAHVAFVLGACFLIVTALRERGDTPKPAGGAALAALAGPWLWTNTLFVLCVGAHWGFHEFHRFIVPALPPVFAAYRRWLPANPVYWIPVAAVSAALAVWGVSH